MPWNTFTDIALTTNAAKGPTSFTKPEFDQIKRDIANLTDAHYKIESQSSSNINGDSELSTASVSTLSSITAIP
jgi:hypothetical protein